MGEANAPPVPDLDALKATARDIVEKAGQDGGGGGGPQQNGDSQNGEKVNGVAENGDVELKESDSNGGHKGDVNDKSVAEEEAGDGDGEGEVVKEVEGDPKEE